MADPGGVDFAGTDPGCVANSGDGPRHPPVAAPVRAPKAVRRPDLLSQPRVAGRALPAPGPRALPAPGPEPQALSPGP